MTEATTVSDAEQMPEIPECPKGGEHVLRFLRQVTHRLDGDGEARIDIFHCTRCLGRIEQLDSMGPAESQAAEPPRVRGPLPRLGGAR